MATFGHTHSADPLGKATDDTIILKSVRGGERKQFSEVLSSSSAYIAAAAVALKPHELWVVEYEVVSATLTLALGSMINTNYLVTGLSAQCSFDKYPTVSVTCIKPSAAAKFTAKQTGTVSVTSGFGIVNKWGATFSQGVSSSMNLSMRTAEAMTETPAAGVSDYIAAGLTVYAMRKDFSVQAYDAITLPTGGYPTEVNGATPDSSNEGWQIFKASWFSYV
jgi:hypothetical protein